MNPMGLVPISFAICAAIFLYLESKHLEFVLQIWAIYLVISSGLKLAGSYMQSIGSITYEWSTLSVFRNVLFILMAGFLWYVARLIDRQLDASEEE